MIMVFTNDITIARVKSHSKMLSFWRLDEGSDAHLGQKVWSNLLSVFRAEFSSTIFPLGIQVSCKTTF